MANFISGRSGASTSHEEHEVDLLEVNVSHIAACCCANVVGGEW